MALLRALTGEPFVFPLNKAEVVIGRDAGCDLVVTAEGASRRHARIYEQDGAHFVEDLGSRNGTYLNSERLHHPAELGDEDQIGIYKVYFRYEAETPDAHNTHLDGPLLKSETDDRTMGGDSVGGRASRSTLDLRLEVEPAAKLKAFVELSDCLAGSFDIAEVLPRILESLFVLFPGADRAFILLRDPATGNMVPRAVRERPGLSHATHSRTLSRTVIQHVRETKESVLSDDAAADFSGAESIQAQEIRSILAVPMLSRAEEVLGIVYLDSRLTHDPFQPDDLEVLICAGRQAARALELIALHEERRDIEAARRIQAGFLPRNAPWLEGYQFFQVYQAAKRIGGDYFDYIPLPDGRWAVGIGDVAGKGTSAALLMARFSAAARFCLATSPDPARAVEKLNDSFCDDRTDVRFITFAVLVFDPASGAADLVNAGHLPPLLRRAGRTQELGGDEAGPPIGILPGTYPATSVELQAGDDLLFCTDGITEARDESGTLFGIERVRAALDTAGSGAEVVGRAVLAAVADFVKDCPQRDDVTLVCVSRNANTR